MIIGGTISALSLILWIALGGRRIGLIQSYMIPSTLFAVSIFGVLLILATITQPINIESFFQKMQTLITEFNIEFPFGT